MQDTHRFHTGEEKIDLILSGETVTTIVPLDLIMEKFIGYDPEIHGDSEEQRLEERVISFWITRSAEGRKMYVGEYQGVYYPMHKGFTIAELRDLEVFVPYSEMEMKVIQTVRDATEDLIAFNAGGTKRETVSFNFPLERETISFEFSLKEGENNMSSNLAMKKALSREQECVREINKLVDKVGEVKERNEPNMVAQVRSLELQITNWEKRRDRAQDDYADALADSQIEDMEAHYEDQLIRPTDQDGGKPLPHER